MARKIIFLIFEIIVVGLCLFSLYRGIERQYIPCVIVGVVTSIVAIGVTIVSIYLDFILKGGRYK